MAKTKCPACAGTSPTDKNKGNGLCSNCNGSGEAGGFGPFSAICSSCNGKGTCPNCKGKGTI